MGGIHIRPRGAGKPLMLAQEMRQLFMEINGQEPHALDKWVGVAGTLEKCVHQDGIATHGETDLIQVSWNLDLFLFSDLANVGQESAGGALVKLVGDNGVIHGIHGSGRAEWCRPPGKAGSLR